MTTHREDPFMSRRHALLGGVAGVVALTRAAAASASPEAAGEAKPSMPGAFLYTEMQISLPFAKVPWRERNPAIRAQPGLLNKTWLAGLETNSVGGLYAFDTIEHAQAFAAETVNSARRMRAAHTSRVFDAAATEEASRAMKSVHYGSKLEKAPMAFVYTEVAQLPLVPFAQRPWREVNPVLWKQPGLLAKTWLSGVGVP